MRALTQSVSVTALFLWHCSNEVLAREGIDTTVRDIEMYIVILSSNEVLAREGIDTLIKIEMGVDLEVVAMRY